MGIVDGGAGRGRMEGGGWGVGGDGEGRDGGGRMREGPYRSTTSPFSFSMVVGGG